MAAAEQILNTIGEIKKSLDAERTEKEQLKAQLEKSQKETAEKLAGFDEMKKSYEQLTKALNEPDYAENSPFKIFAKPRDAVEEAKYGFKSLNHFCHDIMLAETKREFSPILKSWVEKASALGLNETVGSEGAFTVPPQFNMEILKRTYDNPLLKMTRQYQAGKGNDMSLLAIDETSRANGSRFGGVQMYWESEAASFTASKPAFNRVNLRLKKLIGLCYVTDELLNDSAVALESVLTDLFAQEAAFKVGNAIVNGSGAGQPLGLLNSGALISVSKETGQAAATIVKENIDKMWSRMYAGCRDKAVWLINQDIEPALDSMALNVGTGGMPAYLPPGGLNDARYAKLKGRDVIPVEFCPTLGTVGDIILVDLSQYVTLRKGETQTDSSIHFKFDTAQTAFRMYMRVDGNLWWTQALTPFQGSNTKSPVVALASRT